MLKVAVVDSGINADHSHIGKVGGGISFVSEAWNDLIGHGTAVAAAIHDHEPRVELYAVKIFDRSFSTDIQAVVKALDWCAANDMDVVNVSLATAKASHGELLREVSQRLKILVAPCEFIGLPAFPGSFPWAFGVHGDPSCARNEIRLRADGNFLASPLPRTLPGLTTEQNFAGSSFAVGNFTGVLCHRILEEGMERGLNGIRSAESV